MTGRELVLGGARSGKTHHAIACAQKLSHELQCEVSYVATAEALDDEMSQRIRRHRTERPRSWRTIEAPLELAQALQTARDTVIVVDCVTLWLSNVMAEFSDEAPTAELPTLQRERTALLRWLDEFDGNAFVVSNEVGSGIVQMTPLARRFQDEQGRLNQSLAELCDNVTLVVAGIAIPIKRR